MWLAASSGSTATDRAVREPLRCYDGWRTLGRSMKPTLLICERKVDDTLVMRAYRIEEHHVVAVWGLSGTPSPPKRLLYENFDELDRSWSTFAAMDAATLHHELSQRREGLQPRLPRIQRNPNRRRDRQGDSPAAAERPYRTGERPERPRIERPRRFNPQPGS